METEISNAFLQEHSIVQLMPNIKSLSYSDLDNVARILSLAFIQYPNNKHRLVIKVDNSYNAKHRYFLEVSKAHLARGNIILGIENDDLLIGVALIRLPETVTKKIHTLILMVRLSYYFGIRLIVDTRKYSKSIRKYFPKNPFIYINFIGIDPGFQKSGAGTILINEIQRLSESHPFSVGVAIETSDVESVKFYLRMGYQIIGIESFNDREISIMFRPNKNQKT